MKHSLLLVACALLPLLRQDPATPAETEDPYPPVRTATVLRYFCLEGDLKADATKKALAELSTKAAACRIAAGPSTCTTRPDKHFLALETPGATPLADVMKALKKGGAKVQELEWTLFRDADEPTGILGFSARECVIGMASDLRWFESSEGTNTFHYVPGKLAGAKLADLYGKLYQPFDCGNPGTVVRETIEWKLAEPVDPAAAKKAEKAIAKLDGVRTAKIDAGASTLGVTIELDGLRTSGPPPAAKPNEEAALVVFPRFDTNPILDALEKEKLGVAPRKG